MPDAGADLLHRLMARMQRYVVFPDSHSAVAVTAWVTASHATAAFQHATRLVINSPEKRCGKSRLLDIIAGTCHTALISVNATVPAIYRSLGGDSPPTLIIDEADAIWGTKKQAEQNEDLRALINAGFQRDRPALRCVGPHQIPTEFPTFAMVALAGIGKMPDTITDRAVNIELRRRAGGERVDQFRARRDGRALSDIRDELAAWAASHLEDLSVAEPEMPVEDRAADAWEPLIAVADAAGGDWPALVRQACMFLVMGNSDGDEEGSLGVRLLHDIRAVFDAPFMPTELLLAALRNLEESPWHDFDLNARKLSDRLRPYKVKPTRGERNTVRGYRSEDFADAFTRYLRPQPSIPSLTADEQEGRVDAANAVDGSNRPPENNRPPQNPVQPGARTGWTGEDDYPAGTRANGHLPGEGFPVYPTGDCFGAYPICFQCAQPVPTRHKDSEGRPIHGMCELKSRLKM